MGDLAIPRRLAETSVAWEGEPARAWLAELPRLVAEVADAWSLELGPPYEPGGAVSWVAPCRRRDDGAPLALKVQLPSPESDPEALVLAAWDGAGAVRLEAHDPQRRALLLERCEPGTSLLLRSRAISRPDGRGDRPRTQEDALGEGLAVAALLHRAPIPPGVPDLADVVGPWADALEAGRGAVPELADEAVELALATMRGTEPRSRAISRPDGRGDRPRTERDDDGDGGVLLHGDLNPTNVLRSGRGWLAIDPKPVVGEPAFDAARLVLQLDLDPGRDPVAELAERVDRAAAALGADRGRVARWCTTDVVRLAVFAARAGDRELCARQLALLPHVLRCE